MHEKGQSESERERERERELTHQEVFVLPDTTARTAGCNMTFTPETAGRKSFSTDGITIKIVFHGEQENEREREREKKASRLISIQGHEPA